MPEFPCRCPNGHTFTQSQATDLDFVCDRCDGKITCGAPATMPSPGRKAPSGEEPEN